MPGLMTADPAVVPDARLIPHIGYRQMRALSRAGAQVLHPDCLDPVAMAGIPTRLRDTAHPDSFGTLIDERCERVIPCIAGQPVAYLPDLRPAAKVTVFAVPGDQVLDAAATLTPLGSIVNNHENARVLRGSEKGHFELAGSTVVLLVEKERISLQPQLKAELERGKEVYVKRGMWIASREDGLR